MGHLDGLIVQLELPRHRHQLPRLDFLSVFAGRIELAEKITCNIAKQSEDETQVPRHRREAAESSHHHGSTPEHEHPLRK